MKILHVLSQHPAATGSGISVRNIIAQAAAAGHDNFLVAGVSDDGPIALQGLDSTRSHFVRFDSEKLDFAIPGMSDVMPYASSRFRDLSDAQLDSYEQAFAQAVQRAADVFAPDIVHSHHLWLATAISRRVLPTKALVTSCHSTDLRQLVSCPHLRQRVLPWCRQVDRVLALSTSQAGRITDLYQIDSGRIEVVGGGFDDGLFHYGEKTAPPPVHLLYAGKLSLAKGVDWLLETYGALEDDSLHLHLAGSGSGQEAEACLALAARLGDRVTVHGRLEQAELARLMRHCHLFVLPSFYEGLPLVLLEALSSGCRLIAGDLPGCRELLAAVDSDLVSLVNLPPMQGIDRPDPGDWPVLRSRLALAIVAMADRSRVTPSPAAERCRSSIAPFSWSAVFQRMEKVYARALAG
ncbi:MAG: glycosyltransferase family 4 protein [Desulfopila sp.]